MKTFFCECGNRLYFGNTGCLKCNRETGFCPGCRGVVGLNSNEDGTYTCSNLECQILLKKCHNYSFENICNWCVAVSDNTPVAAGDVADNRSLCQCCQLTEVIPDLSIPENHKLWARLEEAKRRVLFTIQELNLPIGRGDGDGTLPLKFDFMADGEKPVFTGHDQGHIVINIKEADDVEREKARVAFAEPQRTLVGHFRHELGHYYWDVLVLGQVEDEFRAIFGDERSPTYQEALNNYYQNGPLPNWESHYISAYATMHPWEDFAETFGAYLDMMSILDTRKNLPGKQLRSQHFENLIADYKQVGILANELNREMGLKDLVPEVFGEEVAKKIGFVHRLAVEAGAREVRKAALASP
ncbi:zinc-binding metallopeptidase family protein [Planctomicrobium sp. SH668]|uniref:zinc-binding metallopeptidase family protein n=1 Tax=Planctomicrobium sp. SH668 TaxID=3448126 RepID=UPI003F5C5E2B